MFFCPKIYVFTTMAEKKLSYRRGTAQRTMSVENNKLNNE